MDHLIIICGPNIFFYILHFNFIYTFFNFWILPIETTAIIDLISDDQTNLTSNSKGHPLVKYLKFARETIEKCPEECDCSIARLKPQHSLEKVMLLLANILHASVFQLPVKQSIEIKHRIRRFVHNLQTKNYKILLYKN